MIRIVGLDLSLSSTGIALPDGTTRTIKPEPGDVAGKRLNRLGTRLWTILTNLDHTPNVALIEDLPTHTLSPATTIKLAKWHGCVERDLRRLRIPVVNVNPTRLKMFATNLGGASKDQMIAAAVAAGGTPANDDEADAYLLRAIAVLGLDAHDLFNDPGDRARRMVIADALEWPPIEELSLA